MPEALKPGQGTLQKIDGDRKLMLDRAFTRAICKGCRPLSFGEDKYMKEWVLQLTHGRSVPSPTPSCINHVLPCFFRQQVADICFAVGRYQPPCRKGVMNCLLFLSSAATKKVSAEIQGIVHREGLDISISGACCWLLTMAHCQSDRFSLLTSAVLAGDIWGENGISMFGLLAYFIDEDFNFREVLLQCSSFTAERHTGEEIKKKTLEILVSLYSLCVVSEQFVQFLCIFRAVNVLLKTSLITHSVLLQTRHGLGETEKDIVTRVHGCTPDEGSNMLKAWKIFEGAGCVCHRAQNSLKKAMEKDSTVVALMKKVKGITAHFHRSTKVILAAALTSV